MIVDFGGVRSMHPQVQDKVERKPLREIKAMKEDAGGVERMSEEIKARYSRLFGV
jgi:iron(III) transport system substrate-binding protein